MQRQGAMHVAILIVRNLARENARLVTQAGGNAVRAHTGTRYRAGGRRRCVCIEFVAVLVSVACSRAHHGGRGVERRLIGSRQRLCRASLSSHPAASPSCAHGPVSLSLLLCDGIPPPVPGPGPSHGKAAHCSSRIAPPPRARHAWRSPRSLRSHRRPRSLPDSPALPTR